VSNLLYYCNAYCWLRPAGGRVPQWLENERNQKHGSN